MQFSDKMSVTKNLVKMWQKHKDSLRREHRKREIEKKRAANPAKTARLRKMAAERLCKQRAEADARRNDKARLIDAQQRARQEQRQQEKEAQQNQKAAEEALRCEAAALCQDYDTDTENRVQRKIAKLRINSNQSHQSYQAKYQAKTDTNVAKQSTPVFANLRSINTPIKKLPSLEDLKIQLQTQVLIADTEGIGHWEGNRNQFLHPDGWKPFIKTLNDACLSSSSGTTLEWATVNRFKGEYNAVFFPDDLSIEEASRREFPPIFDRLKNPVSYKDVVFRITRPEQSDDPCKCRYRSLDHIVKEIYNTLHGAAYGFAPVVYGVVLFPALVVKGKQLYGVVYIMERGMRDLHSLIDSQTRRCAPPPLLASKSHNKHCTKNKRLEYIGWKIAERLVPLLYRQARQGVINFDSKPGNYILSAERRFLSIDFDVSMYCIMDPCENAWEPNMVVNMLLLMAHVRCYYAETFANGFSSAMKSLMIELLMQSRGADWLFQSRADALPDFNPAPLDGTSVRLRRTFELMCAVYFVKGCFGVKKATPLMAESGPLAPSLLVQLCKYCFYGNLKKVDSALDSALGCGPPARFFGNA